MVRVYDYCIVYTVGCLLYIAVNIAFVVYDVFSFFLQRIQNNYKSFHYFFEIGCEVMSHNNYFVLEKMFLFCPTKSRLYRIVHFSLKFKIVGTRLVNNSSLMYFGYL